MADAMEDRCGRKPLPLIGAGPGALGSVRWTIPPRWTRPIAVDEAAERVNGREVYAWAAIDVDAGKLPAIKATWSRGSMDSLLFLSR